jgi:hypothetical protein
MQGLNTNAGRCPCRHLWIDHTSRFWTSRVEAKDLVDDRIAIDSRLREPSTVSANLPIGMAEDEPD